MEIKKYADSHDIRRLRYIFVDSLDVDPTFEKYREDYEYCKRLNDLFEAHRELTQFSHNKSDWTFQYWEQLKFDLSKNFSEKRFEHMIQVAQVVYAEKIERLNKEREKIRHIENLKRESIKLNNVKVQDDSETNFLTKIKRKQIETEQNKQVEEKRKQLEEENKRVEEARQLEEQKIAELRRQCEADNKIKKERQEEAQRRIEQENRNLEDQKQRYVTVSYSNGTKNKVSVDISRLSKEQPKKFIEKYKVILLTSDEKYELSEDGSKMKKVSKYEEVTYTRVIVSNKIREIENMNEKWDCINKEVDEINKSNYYIMEQRDIRGVPIGNYKIIRKERKKSGLKKAIKGYFLGDEIEAQHPDDWLYYERGSHNEI